MIGVVDRLVRWVAPDREEPGSGVALPPGVELRRSRLVPVLGGLLSGMGRSAAAVTLGRTILLHPSVRPADRLIRHELAHVRQWERHPIAFPFRYTLAHIRFGYTDNPYEREARAAERSGRPGESS